MAGRIPSAWLDELYARTDIVSVVSSYLPLKKDGRRYWGLCPFHNEKTASFSVNSELNLYYCFGCKAGGNVVQFVMEMERCSYMEAVKILADRLHTVAGCFAFVGTHICERRFAMEGGVSFSCNLGGVHPTQPQDEEQIFLCDG